MAHLIHRTKTAKGKQYPTWLWRTTRRHPDDCRKVQNFDTELGRDLAGLRTRTLVALGEISAADLVTDWVRWCLRSWVKDGVVGPFKGIRDHRKPVSWWVSIPRPGAGDGGKVRVVMRSARDSGFDVRHYRAGLSKASRAADNLWRALTKDPIVRLGELRWLESEIERELGEVQEELVELRRRLKLGDISRRDHEADEWSAQLRLQGWEAALSAVRERWDDHHTAIRDALPRTTRDRLLGQVIARAERLQSDARQLSIWRNEHWQDHTLHWC